MIETVHVAFQDENALYKAYMPFIRGGGLFVETQRQYELGETLTLSVVLPDALEEEQIKGKVVWVSPRNNQHQKPPGIGISLEDDDKGLRQQIERLISARLASAEDTHTL